MNDTSRALAAGLFMVFLGLYGLTASGHLYLADAWSVLETARSLSLEGDASIPFDPGYGGGFDAQGRFYSQYGLGTILAAVPAAVLGHHLSGAAPDPALARTLLGLPYSFQNVLVTSLTIALFALVAARMSDPRTGLTAASIMGLATLIGPYARYDSSEPLLGLLLLGAFACPVLGRGLASRLGAGILLGAAFLVKLVAILAIPGLVGLALAGGTAGPGPGAGSDSSPERPEPPPVPLPDRNVLAAGWPLLPGLVLALALFVTYNTWRFGHPLTTGYVLDVQTFRIPFWMGLFGLIASPGKGLLWFAPILVLLPWGIADSWRRHRIPTISILASVIPTVLFLSFQQNWDGDFSYGPRYLVPLLPLLMLLVLPRLGAPVPGLRWTVIALVAGGVVVQAAGILVDPNDYFRFLSAHKGSLGDYLADRPDKVHVPFHAHHFNPDLSPIRGHYFLLGARLARVRGRPSPCLPIYSTVEEENDRRSHRLTPILCLEPPGGTGGPDLWWIQLGPLFAGSAGGRILLLVALVALGELIRRGRRRIRLALRAASDPSPTLTP